MCQCDNRFTFTNACFDKIELRPADIFPNFGLCIGVFCLDLIDQLAQTFFQQGVIVRTFVRHLNRAQAQLFG